ncbi:MAG: hypothetical protein HN764_05585 [Gammaproteobacteria bacterium]|jgi:hypothetical protein|nr:hypothetical protein [Gammaproteobacteria bacterium]
MKHRDNAFSLPIRIIYQPPATLLYFMTFIHVGSLFCLIYVGFPIWLKLLIVLLISINYLRFYTDFVRNTDSEHKPVLILGRENKWTLIDAEKNAQAVKLEPAAYVHRLLLVLRFTVNGGKTYPFILTSENVERNILRRLRVRLRHDKRSV